MTGTSAAHRCKTRLKKIITGKGTGVEGIRRRLQRTLHATLGRKNQVRKER